MFMGIVGVCIGFSAGVLIVRLLPSTGAVKRFFRKRRGNPRPVDKAAVRRAKTAEKEWGNFLSYTGDKQAKVEVD